MLKFEFKAVALVVLLSLISCKGGGGSGGGASSSGGGAPTFVPGATVSSEQIESLELNSINEELNNPTYELSTSELDQLLNDGMITEEEYNDLLAMANGGGQNE